MKEGWEIIKLEQICDIISGRNQKAVESPNGQYPIYGSGGIMGYASDFLCEAGATIIGRKGSINNPIYVQTRFWNVDTAFGMLPKPNMHSKLFYYFCLFFDFSKMNKGTTIPSLVKKDLYQIDVPYNASLAEQQRIVDILDAEFEKIDTVSNNAEKSLLAAKDLFQATLKKELQPCKGWKSSAMGEVSLIARGGSPRPIKAFITDSPDGVNWIKIGDTEVGGKYIYTTKEKIKREGMRSSRYVESGDFLLSNSMSFGRPYILRTNGCIHDGWLVIKDYETSFTQDFLYYLLLSPIVVKQFEEGARGSTVRNLNTDIVSAVKVSYPTDQKDQEQIVCRIEAQNDKCKSLQENYSKTIDLCSDLKRSLLRKAFNGEL